MEQWTDWVKTSGQLSSHIFSSLWTQQQIFNKTKKSNLYTYIYCLLCFFPHRWNTYIWLLHLNVHFWNKWCGKASQHSQLRDRGVNEQRKNKKSGAKQHRAKAGASTCVIIFADLLHLGLCRAAVQLHLLHICLCLRLPPSQDWSWPAPALASCPRRTVTAGNALGK